MQLVVHSDDTDAIVPILNDRLPDVRVVCCRDYASLAGVLERERPEILYSVKFAGTPAFPRQAILSCTSLRWVSIGGSGTDHLAPWDPARLIVTNAAGVAAEAMAHHALASILAFSMGFPGLAGQQRRAVWAPRRVTPLSGRTLAVLGLGQTGQAVARLAKPFGMRVVGLRARPLVCDAVEQTEPPERLHAVLGTADFVVVCLPLTSLTRHFLDEAEFRAMRPSACLVDLSRGGIVAEAALLRALRSGRLAGAALDVFAHEPLPPDHPLWAMTNVIITPHCSSVYDGWQQRAIALFCDNVERWRQGKALANVVDPRRGY